MASSAAWGLEEEEKGFRRTKTFAFYHTFRKIKRLELNRTIQTMHDCSLSIPPPGHCHMLPPNSKARNVMLSTGNADGRGLVGKVRHTHVVHNITTQPYD